MAAAGCCQCSFGRLRFDEYRQRRRILNGLKQWFEGSDWEKGSLIAPSF
jgi:hypothetical protein